jgi:protein-disulfide isomerase
MRLPHAALLLAVCALALGSCRASADDDAAFGARVRAYLLAHPELLREMAEKLADKEAAEASALAKPIIEKNRQAIEHDPRDFVANPAGKVTVTEFYDYRCPHCINAAPAVLGIIHDDPNVRFVFKEFPIFGDLSDRAAAGAIAIKMAGGDSLGYYAAVMSAKPLTDEALDGILKAKGIDPARLDAPDVQARVKDELAAVRALTKAIDIEGTPTFIIGDTLIEGERMDDLRAAIKQAGG